MTLARRSTVEKRHIIVDTMGLLLAVVVHPANIQDRDGAKLVIDKLIGRFPRMRLVWADAGYAGKLVEWVWGPDRLGTSRLSSAPGTATVFKCCREDGWSNEHSRGSAGAVG